MSPGFPPRRIIPYIASQIAGAFVGAACVYFFWAGYWPRAIEKLGVEVGLISVGAERERVVAPHGLASVAG